MLAAMGLLPRHAEAMQAAQLLGCNMLTLVEKDRAAIHSRDAGMVFQELMMVLNL